MLIARALHRFSSRFYLDCVRALTCHYEMGTDCVVHRARICGSQVLRQCCTAGDTVLHISRKQTKPSRVILSNSVTRHYRAELLPVTLTVLELQSDSYIYDRMICHSSVNFTTVMFKPSDRKNGLSYLSSAFYVKVKQSRYWPEGAQRVLES